MKLFQARFSVLRASLRTLGSAALVVSVVLTAVLGNVSPVLADSGWGVAQRLDGYDSYSTDPQVAMDGLHAVAVWVQHNNWSYDTYEIYSNYSTDGGASWDAPQRVDTGTVRYSDAPRLSVSGPIAVAVWYAWLDMGAGLETRVLSSHSHDGGASWSAPVAIDVSGATGPTEPEVTVSGTTVVATWRQDDVSGPRIYINSSNDGGVTWSGPQIIDPGLGYSIESPRLAVDGSRVVAVWRTNHYSEAVWDWVKDIYSNYSLDGGETWGTAQVISTTTEVYSPHVTMFGSNVVAAWYDGGGNPRIYTNRSVDGGESWEGPQAIDDGSAWGKYSPRLAMYGNTVAAIWSQWQAGYTFPRLCGIRSTDGGTTWDNRQFLDNTIHGVFSEPQIAALGSGFITVWGGTDGYASHIRGRVSKDGGATWDTPETIRDNVDGHPRLATGSSAVAVWSYQHSGRTDIEANHFFQPEPPPLLLDMWGTRGSGDGQFRNPSGITVGPDGRVYVLEDGNHRVQVFDVDGNYLLKWGGSGSDPGEFRYPKIGIVVDGDGNIVVADSGRHRIQVFEPDGSNPVVWGESGGGELQFSHPRGIAIGAGGHIYVCDYGNDRIQVLTSSGEYHKEWGEEGSDPGQLDGPQGIAIDGDGNVYVVDTLNHRVQVFDSDGVFIRTWGSEGDGNGQFQWPRDIAISQDERVYVTDTFNHRIQMFDLEGKYLGQWGSEGDAYGEFNAPQGIALDANGDIYIADTDNHRIQVFTYRAEEFPLDLEFGWNLVSFHAKPLYDWHYDFLIPGFGPMYEWDAQSQSYEGPDRLQTGRGYWIRATAAETTTVWGVPREKWTLELFPGWNIIGSISETTSVNDLDHDCGEDTLLMATMYRWNPGSKTYSIETTIEPGRAYWLASNDDCTVTLGPPEPR